MMEAIWSLNNASHKDGVGKTVTAQALGVYLATVDLCVVLIELVSYARLIHAGDLGLELDSNARFQYEIDIGLLRTNESWIQLLFLIYW